jgi:hypothetical protein
VKKSYLAAAAAALMTLICYSQEDDNKNSQQTGPTIVYTGFKPFTFTKSKHQQK